MSKCKMWMKKIDKWQQNKDQKWNKEHQQQNEDTTKTSSEVLPSKVPSLGVFDFKKKNYSKS